MTLRSLLAQVGIDVAGKTITVDGRPIDVAQLEQRYDEVRDAAIRRGERLGPTALPDVGDEISDAAIREARAPSYVAGVGLAVDPAGDGAAVLVEPARCGEMVGATPCRLEPGHVPSKHDPAPEPPVAGVDHQPDWAIAGHYTPAPVPGRTVPLRFVFARDDALVEIEDEQGRSVRVGTWGDDDDLVDGRTVLAVLTVPVAATAVSIRDDIAAGMAVTSRQTVVEPAPDPGDAYPWRPDEIRVEKITPAVPVDPDRPFTWPVVRATYLPGPAVEWRTAPDVDQARREALAALAAQVRARATQQDAT